MRKETEINEMDGKLHEEYENRLQQALEELREVYDKQMQQSREDFAKLYDDRVSARPWIEMSMSGLLNKIAILGRNTNFHKVIFNAFRKKDLGKVESTKSNFQTG
jgi:hypothetical protein